MKNGYFEQHKKLRLILRIIIALCILFNYGALIMTNALVVKENARVGLGKEQFVELNSNVAKTGGLKTTPSAQGIYFVFVEISFIWAFVYFAYFLGERHASNVLQAYLIVFFVIYVCVLTSRDFFNDLGFCIGWLIWK